MKKWKNYGESSLTLLAVHCGMDKDNPVIPLDPSDFVRCVHLFECLNLNRKEIYSLLKNTSEKYPLWLPFFENWGELVKLYNKERNQVTAPKLYNLIQKLRGN